MTETIAWRVLSRAVLFTIAVLIGLWLLSQITAVIVRLVLAVILAAGMKPLVDRLTRVELRRQGWWTPPRGLVVLLVYVVTILVVVVVGSLILQVVVREVTNLVNGVPVYAPRIVAWVNDVLDVIPGGRDMLAGFDMAGQLSGIVSQVFGVVGQAVQIFQYVVGLVSGAAGRLDDPAAGALHHHGWATNRPVPARVLAARPPRSGVAGHGAHLRAARRAGSAARSLLCVIIGVMSWVGLTAIGVPYAAVLALIAGIMEAVPNIGPIIAAVPAVMVAALYSPVQAVAVLVLYLVIQQLENYVIVPRVMSRAVELHPLAVLLALMVGGELMGVLGAVLAVPVTAAISVIVDEIRSERLTPSLDLEDVVSDDLLPEEGTLAEQVREDALARPREDAIDTAEAGRQ